MVHLPLYDRVAMDESRAPTLDDRMLRAVAHPLRFRVLVALGEEVSSPNQVAAEAGEPLGRVAHHVRLLARLGAIELVSTRPRRGATEHFYRAVTRPWFDDGTWAQLPLSTRRTLVGDTLRRIASDVSAGLESGAFDDLRALREPHAASSWTTRASSRSPRSWTAPRRR